MTLAELLGRATEKGHFADLGAYVDFAVRFLEFLPGHAGEIYAQNEPVYRFYQFRDPDRNYPISRAVNTDLMYGAADADLLSGEFPRVLAAARELPPSDHASRSVLRRSIYTLQQAIGATLDALPAGQSNVARKLNGDLFERLIQLLVQFVGVPCEAAVVKVPVPAQTLPVPTMTFQHDLVVKFAEELKLVGSVKTSSKDRVGKIFLDKLLYSRLTRTAVPHVAIFLNDVQRAGRRADPPRYRVSQTFLPGHFRAYTLAVTPLDGVYYCDLRPVMRSDPLFARHIQTIDAFFTTDLWEFCARSGTPTGARTGVEVVKEAPTLFDD